MLLGTARAFGIVWEDLVVVCRLQYYDWYDWLCYATVWGQKCWIQAQLCWESWLCRPWQGTWLTWGCILNLAFFGELERWQHRSQQVCSYIRGRAMCLFFSIRPSWLVGLSWHGMTSVQGSWSWSWRVLRFWDLLPLAAWVGTTLSPSDKTHFQFVAITFSTY